VAKGEEIAAAIDAAKASGATALNVSASPLFFTHRQLILDRVAALRLPAIYEWPETAEEGGFAAYGPRLDQLFLEVMIQQLIKLFRGIKVADIPIEQPTNPSRSYCRLSKGGVVKRRICAGPVIIALISTGRFFSRTKNGGLCLPTSISK
jgi:hypothetical protein